MPERQELVERLRGLATLPSSSWAQREGAPLAGDPQLLDEAADLLERDETPSEEIRRWEARYHEKKDRCAELVGELNLANQTISSLHARLHTQEGESDE